MYLTECPQAGNHPLRPGFRVDGDDGLWFDPQGPQAGAEAQGGRVDLVVAVRYAHYQVSK